MKEEDPRDHANDSVQFADYPFDVFGRGVGWGSPIKTFEMTLRVLMEQLRGARMVLAMALFYVYLGLFTTVTLSANKVRATPRLDPPPPFFQVEQIHVPDEDDPAVSSPNMHARCGFKVEGVGFRV